MEIDGHTVAVKRSGRVIDVTSRKSGEPFRVQTRDVAVDGRVVGYVYRLPTGEAPHDAAWAARRTDGSPVGGGRTMYYAATALARSATAR